MRFGKIVHNEFDQQKLERLNVKALRCVYNKRVPFPDDDDYGFSAFDKHRHPTKNVGYLDQRRRLLFLPKLK